MEITGAVDSEIAELGKTAFNNTIVTFSYISSGHKYYFQLKKCKFSFRYVEPIGTEWKVNVTDYTAAAIMISIIEMNNYLYRVYAMDQTLKDHMVKLIKLFKLVLDF